MLKNVQNKLLDEKNYKKIKGMKGRKKEIR